jgi:uncharacterized protein
MSFVEIEQMFENVRAGYSNCHDPIWINFHWHGGEPLLIPPDAYRFIFDIQRRVFLGSTLKLTNSLQSNFTVMDEARIALLHEFDRVGASLDLFTDLRINQFGVCQERQAIENLERVRMSGVRVGGITVLSRRNLDKVREIYGFYRERGMNFRLLPLAKGLYATGQDFEIGPRQVLEAFCKLADCWLDDDAPITVSPLDRYLSLVLHALQHPENRVALHDPEKWASVLLVDTNGSVYAPGDRFERSSGNLFTTPIDRILASHEYRASVETGKSRMRETCTGCRYYGRACSGDPVAESQQDFTEHDADGRVNCIVARGIIQHLEQRLETGTVAAGVSACAAAVFARQGFRSPVAATHSADLG